MRIRRTELHEVDRDRPDPGVIRQAAQVLLRGGLVVFPTETVYGVGANAFDVEAVASIFQVKERPASDPLIVHVAGREDLERVASEVSLAARRLLEAFWPGPLTLVLPRHARVPALVSAHRNTIGVRMPAHPVARALLQAAGVPVAAPSANRFSRPSPTRAAHALADLGGRVEMVLDSGPADIGLESTVVDLTVSPPLVRRPGGVTVEALQAVLPELRPTERYSTGEAAEAAPGQLLRHYAPQARLTLYEGDPRAVVQRVAADARAMTAAGQRVGILAPREDLVALAPLVAAQTSTGRIVTQEYGSRTEPKRAAFELFHALRAIDVGVDEILATGFDGVEIGRAIRDRLVRAAEGRVCRI